MGGWWSFCYGVVVVWGDFAGGVVVFDGDFAGCVNVVGGDFVDDESGVEENVFDGL